MSRGWKDYLSLYEYNPETSVFDETVIADNISMPLFSVNDMDNNGRTDVVVSHGEQNDSKEVWWYENQSDGGFEPHLIAEDVFSDESPPAGSVYAGDVNQDGLVDVFVSAYNDALIWYENQGEAHGFVRHEISSSLHTPCEVVIAHLDDDDHLDVILATYYDRELKWFKNDVLRHVASQ